MYSHEILYLCLLCYHNSDMRTGFALRYSKPLIKSGFLLHAPAFNEFGEIPICLYSTINIKHICDVLKYKFGLDNILLCVMKTFKLAT